MTLSSAATIAQDKSPAMPAKDRPLPCHLVQDLMQGGHSAHIKLGEQLYTLRITRAGKLILTK